MIIGAAVEISGTASMKVKGRVGFGPWDHEALADRIERLRRAFENHERILNELDKRLDDEESARRGADEQQGQSIERARKELTDLIRDAAAGGLHLETIGVVLFALGVALGTWGNLVT